MPHSYKHRLTLSYSIFRNFAFFSSQLQSPSVGTGLGGVTARLGGAVLWGRVGRGWSGVCESLQGWGQQCHRGHLVQVMLQEMPPRKGLWALRDCVITSHFTRSERTAHLICSHFACLVLHAFGCSWCIGSFFYCSQGFFQRGNYFYFFFSLALQNHSNWQEGSQGGTALDTDLREKIIIIKRRRMKANSLTRVFQEVVGTWSSLPRPGVAAPADPSLLFSFRPNPFTVAGCCWPLKERTLTILSIALG